MKLLLNSADKIKDFVNAITPYNASMELGSARYMVNAKSIMGILSLDLSKPVEMLVHLDDDKDKEQAEELKQIYCIMQKYQA